MDATPDSERLRQALTDLRSSARERLTAETDAEGVEALRVELLGRSGSLTALIRQLASVEPAQRPELGRLANEVRDEVEAGIAGRLEALTSAALGEQLTEEAIDMTAPGRPVRIGHLHPTMTIERQLREIFHAYGFEVVEGPEIETEAFNFELLNIPPDHPSRDLWDSLYVAEPGSVEAGAPRPAGDGTILRTHTSPVQIRVMRQLAPPIRVIMPGRCYRYENVAADRNFEFFQVEGLVVDRDTSLADLKGILEAFAQALYGPDTATRFRPGYYPFTEPSAAFDIRCQVCGGPGCAACKRTGWVTLLGAGMVHPVVLRNGGYDPDEYQGYAFGIGLDRITMNRYGISDMRSLMGADLRFVEQFSEGR